MLTQAGRTLLTAAALATAALAATAFAPKKAQAAEPTIETHAYFDAYYGSNLNRPRATSAPNSTSVGSAAFPDGQNTYRYYDNYANQLTLSLAELSILAKRGGASLLVDLDFGPFAELNVVAGGGNTKVVDDVLKHVGQAVLSYRPDGSRFFFEFGKMYTHVGLETAKARDNFNYSRTVIYTYLPFWHTGARVGYDVIPDQLQTSLYVYNGWNSLYDINHTKTLGAQVKYTISPTFNVNYNFIGGPERADSEGDLRLVHELNSTWSPLSDWSFAIDAIHGTEQGYDTGAGRTDAHWYGAQLNAKFQFSEKDYLSPRYELLRDAQGFLLGAGPQTFQSGTFTYGRRVSSGLDFRGEVRRDWSSATPFVKGDAPASSQTTLTAAVLFTY